MNLAASTSAAAVEAARPRLVQSLGTWELAAVATNGVIGSGIFGLPSLAFSLAGSYSLVAFGICALLTLLIVLCFAEVSSRFSQTGGPYLYAREGFGPAVGFLVGWLLWLSWVAAFAANCNLLMNYGAFAWPVLASGPMRAVAMLIVVAALSVLNLRGVGNAARASNWLTCVKLGSLLGFVAVGVFFIRWDRLALGTPPAARSFFPATLLLMWAFAGFEKAAVPAGEARDPRSGLPAALTLSVAIAALFYVAIHAVAMGTVPDLAHSTRPLADAARQFLGPAGAALISVAAAVSIMGNLNVLMLSGARLPFAMAEQGELPRALAATHAKFRTPHFALAITTVAAAALTLSGTFVYAVTVSTIARLLAYLATCVSLLVFRRRAQSPPARFRLKAGAAVVVAASLLIGALIGGSSWREVRDTGVAIVVGLLLATYRVSTRRASQKWRVSPR